MSVYTHPTLCLFRPWWKGRGVGEGCMEGVTRIPDMQLAFVVAGFYGFSWHLVFIMSGLLHGDVFLTSWRLKQPCEIIESDHKPRVIAFSNWSLGIIHKEIQKKCMFSRVSGNQIKNCFLQLFMSVSSKILLLTCKEKCIRVSRCLILQWDSPSNFLKLDFISYFQPYSSSIKCLM